MPHRQSFTVPYKACMVKTGTSTTDGASDYSVTPGVFEITDGGTDGINITINKIVVFIVSATAAADSSEFGDLATLTNGITLKYDVANTNVATIGTYKSILELELISDAHYEETLGTDFIHEYEIHLDTPIVLKGGHNDKLYFELDDNFAALNGLYFSVTGHTNTPIYTI